MKLPFKEIAMRLGSHSGSETVIDTLLTDSRSLRHPDSTLFFAIRTPGGNDGHNYIPELYRKGVRHFVVNEIPEVMRGCHDAEFAVVADSVKALQEVASRDSSLQTEVVAITGSRGKTTLKEWIYQLVEPLCETARSPRSYNSQIGVPLSMWEIEPSTGLAIIEAGISRKGEMEALANCIRPDVVIFTNIGDAHSEGFSSTMEKAAEKALLASLPTTRKVIYNADSEELRRLPGILGEEKEYLAWSTTDRGAWLFLECDTPAIPGELAEVRYYVGGKVYTIEAPVENAEDLENTGGALAFMLSEGMDHDLIKERFADLHKISTRLNVTEGVNGCSLIHDSYTSDFSSLLPAVDFMMRRAMPHQSATLILSDIRHETAGGRDIYQAVAEVARDPRLKRFIGIGPELRRHASLFPSGSRFYADTEEFLSSQSTSDFMSEIILLKGAPEFGFGRINEMLEARKHETVLEVNLDAIVANYNYFRSHIPSSTGIVAMVKASGYGAGSYEIAKTLQDCGAAYLAVAVLDEGIDLRRNGITMPVMVMNPKVVNYRSMFSYRLEPEIYSLEMLHDVIREGRKNGVSDYPIHLKLDTGMHRTGFLAEELPEVVDLILSQNVVRLSSVFSHLATADCLDMDEYTERQLDKFREMTDYILTKVPYGVRRHILNTAGILRFPAHHYDMVRLGIGLYGANTLPPEIERPLAVVSTLRTVITAIREYEAGEAVGYGRKGVLTKRTRVATLPIGYADGMNRHFGRGNIMVKVNGKDAPTIGNICMDACMIDVSGIECKVGDAVEIFGNNAPLQRLADLLDTIPYEILTSVSPRVKRIYYRE